MTYKDKIKAAELRQRVVQHDRAYREAEHFLKTVEWKIEALLNQITALKASVEPMKAKSRRASTLKRKNTAALSKLFGKIQNRDKLVKYKRAIRELEQEIAQG